MGKGSTRAVSRLQVWELRTVPELAAANAELVAENAGLPRQLADLLARDALTRDFARQVLSGPAPLVRGAGPEREPGPERRPERLVSAEIPLKFRVQRAGGTVAAAFGPLLF